MYNLQQTNKGNPKMVKRYNEELFYSEIFDDYSVQMEEHSEGRWVEYTDILSSIKAKPLEWKHSTSKVHEGCTEYAETPFGTYFINYDNDDFTGMYCDFVYLGNCTWFGTGGANSREITSHVHEDEPYTETKAAAEAHYQEAFKATIMIGEH